MTRSFDLMLSRESGDIGSPWPGRSGGRGGAPARGGVADAERPSPGEGLPRRALAQRVARAPEVHLERLPVAGFEPVERAVAVPVRPQRREEAVRLEGPEAESD